MAKKVTLDFTGVEAGFTPVPEGRYLVTVTEVKEGRSEKGNDTVSLTLKIYGPSHKGRQLWHNLTLGLESTMPIIKMTLLGFGYPEASLKAKTEIDWDDLMGAQATVTVKHREYKNQMRANVVAVGPVVPEEELLESNKSSAPSGSSKSDSPWKGIL